MEGKFNREYRRFAESAKAAGYSEIERRALAHDKNRIVNEGGRALRRDIGAENLSSFFGLLGGDRRMGPDDVRALADFLYKYRSNEKTGAQAQEIPDGQWRLINLGCRLIEDAFYRGNLLNFSKDHGAALSFLINVIAKIAENPKNEAFVTGFDTKKAEKFLSDVSRFQKAETAKMVEESNQLSTSEQSKELTTIEEQKQKFDEAEMRIQAGIQRRGPAAVAYLIKTCLIANDMAAGPRRCQYNALLQMILTGAKAERRHIVSTENPARNMQSSISFHRRYHLLFGLSNTCAPWAMPKKRVRALYLMGTRARARFAVAKCHKVCSAFSFCLAHNSKLCRRKVLVAGPGSRSRVLARHRSARHKRGKRQSSLFFQP